MTDQHFECPSIFVPRIFKSVRQRKIRDVFTALQLGDIETIDLHLGKDFQRAYIYFKQWYPTPEAEAIKARFLEGEEIKIIYDDPWFWKCKLNLNKKTASRCRKEAYVSKYNSSNQILALKRKMSEERAVFKSSLEDKDRELDLLREVILSFQGDNALVWRKFIQQKKAKQLNKENNLVSKLNKNI